MMFVAVADLQAFAEIDGTKAEAMIADAEATAISVAPCLVDPNDPAAVNAALSDNDRQVVKAVLRAVILRWNESGPGAVVQQAAGPFSQTVDNRSNKYGRFWPSEIEQLRSICSNSTGGKAFAVSQVSTESVHLAWCSISLGANYCSCGADIAGTPIYENL